MKPLFHTPTVESLASSQKKVRQLYPVLVDSEGNIIDGQHRKLADENWETRTLDWVKTEKDRVITKIHANIHRREVSIEERKEEINKLAKIAHDEGIPDQKIASTLAEWTSLSDDYVRELLEPGYKNKEMSVKAKERTKKVRVEPEVLQKEAEILPNYDQFSQALDLTIGILLKWELAYKNDYPITSEGLKTLKQSVSKFQEGLKSLRKPEETAS